MRLVAATLVLFMGLPIVARAAITPAPLALLQSQLSAMSMRAPGHIGLEIQDLATGLTSSVNAGVSMPAASTIKIPVMVEVFRQLALGSFDLNMRVRLRASDKDWGSGSICDAHAGTGFPVSQLLTAMITVSDNTAANMLIRLVGRARINRTMAELGLHHTKLADFIRTDGWGIRNTLRSSPADMVRLLSKMAHDKLIDEWSSRQMIAILEADQINTLVPQPLPTDLQIAHKTGSLDDTLNDVGIVYAGREPYVIAVMTTGLPSLGAGRRFIRKVSRTAYDDLLNFADWRDANGMTLPITPQADAQETQTNTPTDAPFWGQNPVATPKPHPTSDPNGGG
ncbi:MAG: class A beta-lactamase-related serine hydrolase [Candidatus Eremiobacteraeota bacterium]|nr:class A beta-lactamase-related serine hydrolase [Candidatus Eremiobacteraeota bacterium]